jgi:acyl carrier protein
MKTQALALSDHDIATGLLQTICDVLKLDIAPHEITAETSLYELGLESLRVVELLSTVEKQFGITIDVEDLSAELFERLGNVVEFVRRKIDEAR